MDNTIYKIFTHEEWIGFEKNEVFSGSAADKRDGFIHLSTGHQLKRTIEKHFTGKSKLVVAEFESAPFGDDLKWEKSTSGDIYPHLYRDLTLSAVIGVREN